MDRESLAASLAVTTAELRTQLSLITAAGQLLEQTAGEKERRWLAALNQGVCRMLRTVSRMELAYRLTDENEIRSFPDVMDATGWAEEQARGMVSALELADTALSWSVEEGLLLNGDKDLLSRMLPEMVDAAVEAGSAVKLSVSRRGDNIHISVTAEGDGPQRPCTPRILMDEEDMGIAMIRLVAQIHGGALITCQEGGLCRSLTVILPQRLDLPGGRLESPCRESPYGGFDPMLVAFSHRLPDTAFFPEE